MIEIGEWARGLGLACITGYLWVWDWVERRDRSSSPLTACDTTQRTWEIFIFIYILIHCFKVFFFSSSDEITIDCQWLLLIIAVNLVDPAFHVAWLYDPSHPWKHDFLLSMCTCVDRMHACMASSLMYVINGWIELIGGFMGPSTWSTGGPHLCTHNPVLCPFWIMGLHVPCSRISLSILLTNKRINSNTIWVGGDCLWYWDVAIFC